MDEFAKDFPNCAKEARSALKKVKELAAEYENENQGLREEIKKLNSPAEFHGLIISDMDPKEQEEPKKKGREN